MMDLIKTKKDKTLNLFKNKNKNHEFVFFFKTNQSKAFQASFQNMQNCMSALIFFSLK